MSKKKELGEKLETADKKLVDQWRKLTQKIFLCSEEATEAFLEAILDNPVSFEELLPFWIWASQLKGIGADLSGVIPLCFEISRLIRGGCDPSKVKRLLADVMRGELSNRSQSFLPPLCQHPSQCREKLEEGQK